MTGKIHRAPLKRKQVRIGPAPGDDFEMLLFVLDQEVTFARLHMQIARGLAKKASDEPRLFHCAQTFFAFTFRAHLESAYARTARLFDTTSGALTIPSMIRETNRIAGKFQFATPAEVRAKIKVWQERIATVQPLVERLRERRNGLIAHLDSDVVLDPKEMARAVALSFDEVDQIIEVAGETVFDSLDAYNNATYVPSSAPKF